MILSTKFVKKNYEKMGFEKKEKGFGFVSPSQAPPSIPSSQASSNYGLNNRISPSVLLIIIIIAVIFFISGLLHLLVRFLVRPAIRNSDEIENLSALQGQLQQLFQLHDSGVDQSFIDALPVFNYKAIIGVKDPFDCAVCLSEFEVEDKLRLLPKCSHAFHMDCIDTWLLSHSTCPICRGNLVQDFNHATSPVVRVLESQNSREIVEERQVVLDLGVPIPDDKSREIGDRVVEVKLGKFRNVGGGDAGEGGAEARRCFSMGSFAYVLKEDSSLRVAITDHVKKPRRGVGEHRTAMSECGCDSRREFNGFEAFKVVGAQSADENDSDDRSSLCMSKRESFSWLKSGRKDKAVDEEIGSSLESESFGRNLHWLLQTQNRLLQTTFSSNV